MGAGALHAARFRAITAGMIVFDKNRRRLLMDKAASRFDRADFLRPLIERSIVERLCDIRRDFPDVLCIGARISADFIRDLATLKNTRRLYVLDSSEAFLAQCAAQAPAPDQCAIIPVLGDEECLPFGETEAQFDLILGAATLHSVNDVPGTLIQVKRALKPDGLFMAAMAGGQTLYELRHSLMEAETALFGGASPRVMPFADMQQVAGLMQRAGFALPVVDHDVIPVEYRNFSSLLHDIRAMGEGLCLADFNRGYRPKAFFDAAQAAYAAAFTNDAGLLRASFEIIYALGWAPHESQQKPLRRGSAQTSLTEVL